MAHLSPYPDAPSGSELIALGSKLMVLDFGADTRHRAYCLVGYGMSVMDGQPSPSVVFAAAPEVADAKTAGQMLIDAGNQMNAGTHAVVAGALPLWLIPVVKWLLENMFKQ